MFVCVCVVFRTCAAFWSMLSQLFIVYNTIELHIFNCNEVLTSQIHEKKPAPLIISNAVHAAPTCLFT